MAERYVDYDRLFRASVARLDGEKPRLLLHACCGPCSCYPLEELLPYFEVTVFYGNPNIFPKSEYERRKEELGRLLVSLKIDRGHEVGLIIDDYDHETYMEDLHVYPEEKEGGKRCRVCYEKRLRRAFEVAREGGFRYLTTTLTVSRFKPSQTINQIAARLQKEFPGVIYLHSDFKKRGGIDKGKLIQNRYGLYQQLYCGCEYSYASGLERAKEKGLSELMPDVRGREKDQSKEEGKLCMEHKNFALLSDSGKEKLDKSEPVRAMTKTSHCI